MLRILFIIFVVVSLAASFLEENCKRIRIGTKWYDKEILWSQLGRPYNLNIHKASNTLLFSYSVPETYSEVDFQLAYYNIDVKEYAMIPGIVGGCSVAIDQKNDEIYLGGSDGIYTYNMITKIADYYKEKGKNIWGLFYKRNLFYISYPNQKLLMQIDDKFAEVKEFENIEVDYFHISESNEILYANKSGLYKYDNNNSKTLVLSEVLSIRQISEDLDGTVYICTSIGLYSYNQNSLQNILSLKNLHGIAFDKNNNFVLSDEKNIFKLIQSNVGCMEAENDDKSDIYFANKTALYKVESVGRRTVVLSDEVMVRQIADDKYGDIYICGTD
ncbi:unnamed protein product, partial [Leptidea sinapis]